MQGFQPPQFTIKDFLISVFDNMGKYYDPQTHTYWIVLKYDALGAQVRGSSCRNWSLKQIIFCDYKLEAPVWGGLLHEGQSLTLKYDLLINNKKFPVWITPASS